MHPDFSTDHFAAAMIVRVAAGIDPVALETAHNVAGFAAYFVTLPFLLYHIVAAPALHTN